jgi:hypothetical protein
MSLQLIAKQMEAKGRGGDSVLVHMTPEEVAGLQKLAESAGGSLSVNPETGLVEANFLKRMLPTLVGIGVGMFAGPMAGAAAGAAVGGYQAKRNNQDVGMGALMGGLGGYGGGTMGAGLTAAGAGAAGAAAPMTASQGLSQAGQGISALGTEAGRGAFMSKVGGGAGLLSDVSMAAAPLMAPGKRPGEAPVDDEMIVYDYDVGRTGADSMPTGSSAERRYFNPTFSNRRKVRAKDYFSAAEGGEVADAAPADAGIAGGMSGASKAAFDYLMGNAPTSRDPARSPLIDAQLMEGVRPLPSPVVGSDNMYAFDPATGTFLRNPNIPGAATSGSPVGTSFAGSGGSYEPVGLNPDFDTPAKQAAFYADPKNAVFGDITRAGQTALSYTPMSLFARAVAPEYMAQRAAEQDRITRGDYSSGFAIGSDGRPASGYGVDSWSGGMDSYAGSDRDVGNVSAAGGSISLADGGLMGLAKGGMKSGGFVVPADVVSMIGEGNTDAGYTRIKSMIPGATAIKGKDGGQADTVKTSIEGKQPARVAHGEMYVPPETVKRMGGAKKLYAMMDRVRQQATGSKKQIKPVNLRRAMA